MLYTIGQRVIINSLDAPAYVIALNGHTCIIKRILSSKEREASLYYEYELIPFVLSYYYY